MITNKNGPEPILNLYNERLEKLIMIMFDQDFEDGIEAFLKKNDIDIHDDEDYGNSSVGIFRLQKRVDRLIRKHYENSGSVGCKTKNNSSQSLIKNGKGEASEDSEGSCAPEIETEVSEDEKTPTQDGFQKACTKFDSYIDSLLKEKNPNKYIQRKILIQLKNKISKLLAKTK